MKKAFTLIELLVVVLIIGILAAVALPQYQKVVEKSRGAEAIVMLKAITDAQERYYLVNNSYTSNLSDLDVETPTETRFYRYSCDGQSCFADPILNSNYIFWFVMKNRTQESLADNSEGKHWCVAKEDREKGRIFCKIWGKKDISVDYYAIN